MVLQLPLDQFAMQAVWMRSGRALTSHSRRIRGRISLDLLGHVGDRVPEPGQARRGQGIIAGFTNYTGPVQADLLRLNTSIPPVAKPSVFALLGGDAIGFPNGRRGFDDVVSIELRAIAGVTYKLIDPAYTVDPTAEILTDGLTPADVGTSYLPSFPTSGCPTTATTTRPNDGSES